MNLNDIPRGYYGEPGPLRDRLVVAVLSGQKTGTSFLYQELALASQEEPLPQVGDLEAVVDSADEPVCITEVISVEVLPLKDITLAHALDEGEGFTSVDDWYEAHRTFWTSDFYRAELGDSYQMPTPETEVVYVRFKVIEKLR